MEDELLLELEKAYNSGVSLEQIKEAAIANGMGDQVGIVEDFYKKKKTLEPFKNLLLRSPRSQDYPFPRTLAHLSSAHRPRLGVM